MSPDAEIVSIHEMTPRVKQFVIELDDETWDYRPGQHTTIQFEADDGSQVIRPYTPTNYPCDGEKHVLAIKRYDDGTASVYMHEREQSDTITVTEPQGNLYLRDLDSDVAFVSTGTGITPMIAMLKQYLDEGTGDAYFFFGERTQEDLMYRETLDQLAAQHDNLTVVYSLSHEDWRGREGFVQSHIDDVVETLGATDFYLCGVPQMVVDTKERLNELGVPDEQVYSEGWESSAVDDE